MSLNGVSPWCSQTVMKSKVKHMPRKELTPQAGCGSCVFFARGVVPPSNSLLQNQKHQVPSGWHPQGFGQGQKMGAAVPSGGWLWLPGTLCSWKMEIPVVHRGNVQLWEYGRWDLLASLRSSTWFISSSVGKKILACLCGKVAGPWPPLTWFNWGFCQAYYMGCSLAALSKQSRLITNYHFTRAQNET